MSLHGEIKGLTKKEGMARKTVVFHIFEKNIITFESAPCLIGARAIEDAWSKYI